MTAHGDQMRSRAKDVALEQLAAGGPEAVSVNAIGRELGVSGPALYRHFSSRDELLAALVRDAYESLAVALAKARDLPALARAYRRWALAQPHRYGLLFAPPVPGFDAHREDLVAASQKSMETLTKVLGDDDEERAVIAWSRLHGLVSLELGGNFDSMGLDGAALVEREAATL